VWIELGAGVPAQLVVRDLVQETAREGRSEVMASERVQGEDDVALHHGALVICGQSRLVEDPVGHRDLADVVEDGGEAEVVQSASPMPSRRPTASARSAIERAGSAV